MVKAGEKVEVVWMGQVRKVLTVAKTLDKTFICDDGSEWHYYGTPVGGNPWGVTLRLPDSAPERLR